MDTNRDPGDEQQPTGWSVTCEWTFTTVVDVVATTKEEAVRLALDTLDEPGTAPWNADPDCIETTPDRTTVEAGTWRPSAREINDYNQEEQSNGYV